MLKSVEFGRFMTPEGTEKLILAFTSKKGQSVAHNKHRIFLFGFACQREDLFRHFIGLISFRLQTLRVLVIELNKEFFLHFLSIFSSIQPAPVFGNAYLRYHLSRLNQNTQHISYRVL